MNLLRLAAVTLASAAYLAAGGCNTISPETGPTLGVRNDSDAPLRATFWVGDRQAQRPGLPADMKAQDTLEIPPFGTKQFRLRAFSGYESPTESFVRVQIEPVGPSFQYQAQYWYELNPPSPYTIRVFGQKPDLGFERMGGGTMVMVPSEFWFRNAPQTAGAVRLNSPKTPGTQVRQPLATNKPLSTTAAGSKPGTQQQVSGVNDR